MCVASTGLERWQVGTLAAAPRGAVRQLCVLTFVMRLFLQVFQLLRMRGQMSSIAQTSAFSGPCLSLLFFSHKFWR